MGKFLNCIERRRNVVQQIVKQKLHNSKPRIVIVQQIVKRSYTTINLSDCFSCSLFCSLFRESSGFLYLIACIVYGRVSCSKILAAIFRNLSDSSENKKIVRWTLALSTFFQNAGHFGRDDMNTECRANDKVCRMLGGGFRDVR